MAVYTCEEDCDGTFGSTDNPTYCPYCGERTVVELEDYETRTDKI